MEIYSFLGSGRSKRQQGRERRATALPAAAEYLSTGVGEKSPAPARRPEAHRRRQHSVQVHERTQPGTESPRGTRAPGSNDSRVAGGAQNPQEDASDQRLQGAPYRVEEAPRRHQAATRQPGLGL